MESLGFVDDLLNFSSDMDEEEDKPRKSVHSLHPKCSETTSFKALDPEDPDHSFSVSLMVSY